jgi:hypothetical protein
VAKVANGKGQPTALTAAQTTALAARAAPDLSSQDDVKKQKMIGKYTRRGMAPVPDGGETPAAGAEALITISTLSQRVALKSGGALGDIAMKGLSEVLLEHKGEV